MLASGNIAVLVFSRLNQMEKCPNPFIQFAL